MDISTTKCNVWHSRCLVSSSDYISWSVSQSKLLRVLLAHVTRHKKADFLGNDQFGACWIEMKERNQMKLFSKHWRWGVRRESIGQLRTKGTNMSMVHIEVTDEQWDYMKSSRPGIKWSLEFHLWVHGISQRKSQFRKQKKPSGV